MKKTNVFIIHGTESSPEENWFPWLKKELEVLNYQVFVPEFPTPKDQSLKNWMEVFKNYKQFLNRDTVFIGHSLGPGFILNLLEIIDVQIKASYFVSGFTGTLGNEHFDNLNRSFTNKKFDWKKIKANCKKFFVINSDDDPYVPIKKGRELAEKLDTDLIILKNAGHINADSGFNKFVFLLDKIQNEIKRKDI
ncbi:hypothetical protein GF327_09715 [Candidatus Woesearchaeota archaeon]|nr:hypothetical protein [Candidatus Woesearchaeota archaeon]